MSAENFIIHERTVPAQHIRELPNALAVDEGTAAATLNLSVKQYIPRNNTSPRAGDITIIALHACGYHKELYEPLWDDLLLNLPSGVRVRGIWMADMAQHGTSYMLNEQKLADGISWDDHARDLLHLINAFREHMVPPLLGIGHSMGASQLIQLSRLHPRLFHAVALLDPWLSLLCRALPPENHWKISIARKKTFKSIEAARDAYEKVPLFKSWDRRCFDRYVQTAFRALPSMLEGAQAAGVTPTTPAIMTFHTARRVMAQPLDMNADTASRTDRLAYPDRVYDFSVNWPYCMPQAIDKARFLPSLRPRVLFLYAANASPIRPEWQKEILESTGTDGGGSGGARLGCVESDVVEGSHFFPFENPRGAAERLAVWLQREGVAWREEKSALDRRYGHGAGPEQRQQFPPPVADVARTWAACGARGSKL